MQARDFAFWLQGYFELTAAGELHHPHHHVLVPKPAKLSGVTGVNIDGFR